VVIFPDAFFTIAYFAPAFFAAAFLVAALFATAPLTAEDFDLLNLLAALAPVATALAPAIKNFERSFAAASQAGAGPRPLQVVLVFGSRYFAGCCPLRCPSRAPALATAFGAFLVAVLALLTVSALVATVASAPPAIRNLLRSLTLAIHPGARPRPVQIAPVVGWRYFAGVPPFRLLATFDLPLEVLPFAAFASRFAFAFASISSVL